MRHNAKKEIPYSGMTDDQLISEYGRSAALSEKDAGDAVKHILPSAIGALFMGLLLFAAILLAAGQAGLCAECGKPCIYTNAEHCLCSSCAEESDMNRSLLEPFPDTGEDLPEDDGQDKP